MHDWEYIVTGYVGMYFIKLILNLSLGNLQEKQVQLPGMASFLTSKFVISTPWAVGRCWNCGQRIEFWLLGDCICWFFTLIALANNLKSQVLTEDGLV